MSRTAHCPWCSRDGVPVSTKGCFTQHTDAAGKACIGVGMRYGMPDTRTPKKRTYGPVNKRTGRSRSGGASRGSR